MNLFDMGKPKLKFSKSKDKVRWFSTFSGIGMQEMAPTLTTTTLQNIVVKDKMYRIRKLTPREAFRLMDISDSDFNKAKASGMSDTQLYKQAGNGIVVSVVEHILRGLFDE